VCEREREREREREKERERERERDEGESVGSLRKVKRKSEERKGVSVDRCLLFYLFRSKSLFRKG